MKKLSLLLLPALLCACSSDWSTGLDAHRVANSGPDGPGGPAMAGVGPAHSRVSQRQPSTFGSHPDQGSLVHYTPKAPSRQSGAYTWHAADVSEAHAFNAMATGEMTFTAPDGTPIKLDYQRHIEHPDGNWTWVGDARDGSGRTALITFGPDAAFGVIPQPNGQPDLRLASADGRGWVVTTDAALLAGVHNEATDPSRPDYLVPIRRGTGAGAASARLMAGAAPASAAASASGSTTIDVLVGYTNGYRASRGGDSAAQTRIQHMVDITNQAYLESEIDAELRLVHSMQVTFPDNTDNSDALEKLTGFEAPSTETSPDPAFSGLRAARETYGADLVILVRKFNDPENAGCGVAWLLGGDMSGIRAGDEYFGYGVVSDGEDAGSDGSTYYCRDETFAHEVGHLLGSQHDLETSQGDGDESSPGVYAYSYGYKTAASQGNFYTIMAYGDEGQRPYRVFSNPRISTCGGYACGTADADNARSINNTASIIAAFRASVATSNVARNDVDGDGRSELLWRNANYAGNNFRYWSVSDNGTVSKGPYFSFSRGYRLVATGDFNGDGLLDLVWANPSTGRVSLRFGDGASFPTQVDLGAPYQGGWKIEGSGDVDGDGRAELLWRNERASYDNFRYWHIGDSGQVSKSRYFTFGRSYRLVTTGDFDGDGHADLVWSLPSSGHTTIRYGGASGFDRKRDLGSPAVGGWTVAGAGDVTGDGRWELLWRNTRATSQNFRYWQISDGGSVSKSRYMDFGRSYDLVDTSDFNGDGYLDVVWVNPESGHTTLRLGNGTSFPTRFDYGTPHVAGWTIQSP